MALQALDRAVPAVRDAPALVALRRCTPVPRGATGPWLLRGSALEGDAIWFEARCFESSDAGALLGHAVLVRREERRPAADVGFAPSAAPRLLAEMLQLLAHESFDTLGLVRLDTRVRPGDTDAARALDRVGFVFVGFDRRGRHVWSVVPNLVR